MKKIITLIMSILMGAFSLFASACFVEDRNPTGSFGVEGDSSGGGEEVVDPNADPFTVRLHTTDGGALPSLNGISVVWTEINGGNIYQSSFNSEGVAATYRADGEYQITLSSTPTGYTYNPNIYFADNDNNDKVIDLYPLREFTGGSGSNPYGQVMKALTTGAYRFTFESAEDSFFFKFGANYGGNFTFESLLDTTENEILPVLYEWVESNNMKGPPIVGGGASNSYTKNFLTSYELTNSQEKLFNMGVETVNANAFPVVIDILIQKDGEYTQSGSNLTVVPVPENLEDFSEDTPTGTFVHLPTLNGNVLDEKTVVYDSADDRYYVLDADGNADKSKMLYAMLKQDIPGILITSEDPAYAMGLSYPLVRHTCNKAGKDYTQFIGAYFARANTDGSYPLTKALQEYLQDFSVSKQYFFDGEGSAEPTFSADEKSFWLFACGIYQ